MLRFSLFTASAFALVASASAQTPQAVTAEKMPSALKHAGIYHVQSGTWTRTGGQVSNFGPDIVYSNTAESGYFASFGGAGGVNPLSENIDEGGLPGSSNGNVFAGTPNRDEYSINCVQIAYCDNGAPGTSGWTLNFYEQYTPCTVGGTPDETIVADMLPAAGGCWVVDLDLTGGLEFCLQADGVGDPAVGAWDDDPALDSFGWSFRYTGTDGTAPAGFALTGNPSVTDPTFIAGGIPLDGSNTYYGSTNCPGVGTGYLTRDFWWLEDPQGAASNCYAFGGYSNNNGACIGPSNAYASWWMELAADTGPCNTTFGTVYCDSNPNSLGSNTQISLSGSETAADDDLTITGSNMPLNSFGFFIVSETQGFVANPNGSQGNLCVLGAIGRFVGAGQIMSSFAVGEISLSTTSGLFSLTAMPTPLGPRMSTSGTTDNFQLWHRDIVGGAATSNFSDGITHTWL